MTDTLRRTILGIDDVVDELRELTAMLLEHFDVKISADGRQGYERAQALQPDLILLDVGMPGSDGFAVCRLLKGNLATKAIPVMFLSSDSGPAMRVQGFRLGAVDFINKPFMPEEVLARIQIHLRMSGRQRSDAANDAFAGEYSSIRNAEVRAAVAFIGANLDDDELSVDRVAKAVGATEKRLRNLFKEQLGLTVIGCITAQRMSVSRRLLRETGLLVQAIALEVGFKNAGNFATSFREHNGLSPQAYRDALDGHADSNAPGSNGRH